MAEAPHARLSRRTVAIIVAIAVTVAVLVSISVGLLLPRPTEGAPITVYNDFTMSVANVTSKPNSYDFPVYYLNSTAFANQSSYSASSFALVTTVGAFYVGGSLGNYFVFLVTMNLSGWMAPNLHPDSITLTAGDQGPYNNSAALFFQIQVGTSTNVSVPTGLPSFGGNASSSTSLGLDHSSADTTRWYAFSVHDLGYSFELGSYAGFHRLQLGLTLVGLSRPVTIQQDLNIVDAA
jgi:hypothetical protein